MVVVVDVVVVPGVVDVVVEVVDVVVEVVDVVVEVVEVQMLSVCWTLTILLTV